MAITRPRPTLARHLRRRWAAALVTLTLPAMVLANSTAATAQDGAGDRHGDHGHTDGQFVQRSGSRLTLDDTTFRFAGTNNYYLEYADQVMTDAVLDNASASGSTVMRTWAFFDVPSATDHGDKGVYFQYWDGAKPAFNDGADGLAKLDHVIAQAKAKGLRLILPMTNNWATFGGMDQYVAWAGGAHHSDFYTDPVIRGWYKNWIAHLLNRVNTVTGIAYKDDPTIMAWELANEPRCVGSGPLPKDPTCSVATLAPWVDEMSTFVKSIDPRHLVGAGDEGFLNIPGAKGDWTRDGSEGVDSQAFAAMTNIDYMSYHLYPDNWSKSFDWGTQWIADHSAAARKVHKPSILGEYGVGDKSVRNPVYQKWTDTFRHTGGTGALFWILSDIQKDGTLYPDYDGFTVYASSPVSITLKNFSTAMTGEQKTFPPVADNDVVTTDFGVAVSRSVTANDISYDVKLDPRTVDLDPAAGGVQSTWSSAAGTFSAATDGTVTYTPAAGFVGKAVATYRVQDRAGRLSNPATITVTVKPSRTAAQTLFDFSSGTQGWAGVNGTGTVSTDASGHLTIVTPGDWYGAQLAQAQDFSTRTQLRFDLVSTTGIGPILALKLGASWTWCQAQPIPWTTTPATGVNAISFDLTTLSTSCAAMLNEVHTVYIYTNGGQHTIDNVLVN